MAIIFKVRYYGISVVRSLCDVLGLHGASIKCTERIYNLLMKWDECMK